jgi:hypothetical protein
MSLDFQDSIVKAEMAKRLAVYGIDSVQSAVIDYPDELATVMDAMKMEYDAMSTGDGVAGVMIVDTGDDGELVGKLADEDGDTLDQGFLDQMKKDTADAFNAAPEPEVTPERQAELDANKAAENYDYELTDINGGFQISDVEDDVVMKPVHRPPSDWKEQIMERQGNREGGTVNPMLGVPWVNPKKPATIVLGEATELTDFPYDDALEHIIEQYAEQKAIQSALFERFYDKFGNLDIEDTDLEYAFKSSLTKMYDKENWKVNSTKECYVCTAFGGGYKIQLSINSFGSVVGKLKKCE